MKLSDFFELSFCINLEKRKDRLKDSLLEFDKLGYHPQIFKAVENENPIVGCLQSHLTIMKNALQLGKSVLIFEDDVTFVGDYKETIESALDELSTINWDMFYLGANVLNNIYQVTDHLGRLSFAQSTHAYAVNHKFLSTLIKEIETFNTHIDLLYAKKIVPRNKCFITIPIVALQRPSYSDIMMTEADYRGFTLDRFNQFLIRK